ncbi:hypothetical protein MGG_18052 [Pyricularia oryzae 70-15]|uniref:Uncharacterized protein n=1 Tax=Pyricularia oryzae (strain 70-15 / ATCC MYA-4617 / FGSC 8958) TaxID=242507 RepID=G4NKN4_PYRO7|nr:uncharacterized protein MGG_18052 [Pyricularia oryzae 70-15]EHA46623.1 hypothetical protein MGG_18052 [Pyricularia oryzae 70-15]
MQPNPRCLDSEHHTATTSVLHEGKEHNDEEQDTNNCWSPPLPLMGTDEFMQENYN